MNFYQRISKISQIFPAICVFRQNARKFNAGFVPFFENYARIMDFRNFLKKYSESFLDFLKISQQFVFFVQTREKLTYDLLNCLKNMLKYCISAIFLRKFLKILKFSPASGGRGLSPRTPYEADPLKCSPAPTSWRHRWMRIAFEIKTLLRNQHLQIFF